MKVVGLGAPDDLRVHFEACEIDVLVDVLREERANATRDAAQSYATNGPGQTRAIDDRHDRLRAIEALLAQLEEAPRIESGTILVSSTELMCDVAHSGAREALRRLEATHERYEDHGSTQSGDALLNAAETATSWVATLVAVDRIERGGGGGSGPPPTQAPPPE
jgi:hypothetical protein